MRDIVLYAFINLSNNLLQSLGVVGISAAENKWLCNSFYAAFGTDNNVGNIS